MAGSITAVVSEEYRTIEDKLGENKTLQAILIDITAESLIQAMAFVRGEEFAHKVGGEYLKLSPSIGALTMICEKASASGVSQERGIANVVLSDNSHLKDTQIAVQLEQFIALFRQKAKEVISLSLKL
ncbi:MAG TPA: hypothetical protein ENH85_14715 [Candidatus Scalindua sp.]|nr:hypothetical protein [Candidatus Scalindua sp.]